MKTFKDLNESEQQYVVTLLTNELLSEVIEMGPDWFYATSNDDYGRNLRAGIEKAFKAADNMQTPWFVGEYLMDEIGKQIKELALAEARSCRYNYHDEPRIITIPEMEASYIGKM